jgi:hypothetical protein
MNKKQIIDKIVNDLPISDMLGKMTKEEWHGWFEECWDKAINYTHCCTQLPTIIEIDFDGHLKCQIETTDKAPTILKAVNGYGQPVDCNKDKIRITEI